MARILQVFRKRKFGKKKSRFDDVASSSVGRKADVLGSTQKKCSVKLLDALKHISFFPMYVWNQSEIIRVSILYYF